MSFGMIQLNPDQKPDGFVLMSMYENLVSENAELRELVRTLTFCAYASSRDCDDCAMNGGEMRFKADDMAACDGMRKRLYELGVIPDE